MAVGAALVVVLTGGDSAVETADSGDPAPGPTTAVPDTAGVVEETPTTTAPSPVASVTVDGRGVRPAVLETARAIYAAAAENDLQALGAIAGRDPDFTYSFGDPSGDPVAHWANDGSGGSASTSAMTTALTDSVATDGTYWYWPAAFLTDELYFGFRIGIDNQGIWRFSVEGD